MDKAIIAILFLVISFGFNSCKKKHGCDMVISRNMPLPPSQTNWFDSIGRSSITCVSSIGASDSYIVYNHKEREGLFFNSDSCNSYEAWDKIAEYSSSLYGYEFEIRLDFEWGKRTPALTAGVWQNRDYTYNEGLVYEFDSTLTPKTRFVPDTAFGCCGFLNSYTTSLGDTYQNVYFFKGNNGSGVNYFSISQYFGLLDFTTDKGIVWTFDVK